jgi:EAL domain-containing protein (putative c-di-GMP-specific phosphodiesterase class I)
MKSLQGMEMQTERHKHPFYLCGQDRDNAKPIGDLSAASTRDLLAAIRLAVAQSAAEQHEESPAITGDSGAEDLDVSERVWDALRDDRIDLVFQPVCHAMNSSAPLYYECLVRCQDQDGPGMLPAEFIPALERSGLVRLFDRHVFRRVVTLLDQHPGITLGVNISALSAVADVLWDPVLVFLAGRADIARRLVVEITETVPVDPRRAGTFVRRMQELGCRVAVDDFGAGYSLAAAVAIGSVDIIKIDASLIHGINRGDFPLSRLDEVVELASAFADCVVVEGVEHEKDVSLASRAGAEWVQGYHFGLPTHESAVLFQGLS